MITFGGTENRVEDDSVHRLAEHADGRYVLGVIVGIAAFWVGVGYLIWRAVR
jgi:hypothetical protein